MKKGFLQIGNQLRHVLISAVRTLLAALQYDLLDAPRNVRNKFARRRHRLLDLLDCDRNRRLPVERDPPCQHFKQSDPERINIALFIAVSAAGLLRARIVDTSHNIRSDCIAGCSLGDTEIGHLDLAVLRNHDVLRLDVPVNDVRLVSGFQSHRDLYSNADRLPHGEPAFLFNVFFKSNAVDQFHYNVEQAFFLADIINVDDIRMHESRGNLCLHSEF